MFTVPNASAGFKVYQEPAPHQQDKDSSVYSKKLKEANLKKMILDDSVSKRNSLGRNLSNDKNNFDLVSIKKSSLSDLLLETGVYISATKLGAESSRCDTYDNKNVLAIGDRILSINGISLTNKNLYEVMDLVNQCQNFNLVIQKITLTAQFTNAMMYNSSSSILTVSYYATRNNPQIKVEWKNFT